MISHNIDIYSLLYPYESANKTIIQIKIELTLPLQSGKPYCEISMSTFKYVLQKEEAHKRGDL